MKKYGFTLAEVLITLAIIGVIAAITLPTLMTEVGASQVGPKLAKAVSMFEQANESLLNSFSVDSISDADLLNENYGDELSNFIQISSYTYDGVTDSSSGASCGVEGAGDGSAYLSKDGVVYSISLNGSELDPQKVPHKQKVGFVFIDVNANNKPNEIGSDVFSFALYNDGTLRPVGSNNWNEEGDSCTWQDACPVDGDPTDYNACAGHIFENNLKLLYK